MPSMRYWAMLDGVCRGPMSPEELRGSSGTGALTLICPENLDRRQRRNWKFARDMPEVSAALSGPLPARAAAPLPAEETVSEPRSRTPWLLIAVVAALCASFFKRPSAPSERPPDLPKEALAGWRGAVEMPIPRCGRTLQEMVPEGGGPSVSFLGTGRYRIAWAGSEPGGKGDVSFEYDEFSREIKPLTLGARRALDIRSPCPK